MIRAITDEAAIFYSNRMVTLQTREEEKFYVECQPREFTVTVMINKQVKQVECDSWNGDQTCEISVSIDRNYILQFFFLSLSNKETSS